MNGIALAVFISRLPKPFGISIERHGPLRDVLQLGLAILAGTALRSVPAAWR